METWSHCWSVDTLQLLLVQYPLSQQRWANILALLLLCQNARSKCPGAPQCSSPGTYASSAPNLPIPASCRSCKAQQLEHTRTSRPGFSLRSLLQLFTLPKLHSPHPQSSQDSSPCPAQKSPCFWTGLGPSKTSVLLPAVQIKWKKKIYKGKAWLERQRGLWCETHCWNQFTGELISRPKCQYWRVPTWASWSSPYSTQRHRSAFWQKHSQTISRGEEKGKQHPELDQGMEKRQNAWLTGWLPSSKCYKTGLLES